jgi:hypothetical protein
MDRYGPSIDAETAQRLLDGEVAGPPRLARLLASVAYVRAQAPTGPLPGEERAVAAYRAAQGATRPGRGPVRSHAARGRRGWSRALVVGVAAIVLSGGGVAVAAATGVIPNPIPLHGSTPHSDGPQPSVQPDDTGRTRGNSTGAGSSGLGRTAGPSGSAVPLPSDLNGLCHAWAGDFSQDPSVAEHNPRYADLIAVAGGVDKVNAFCQEYLVARTPGDPKSSSSLDARPSAQPSPTATKNGH